METAKTFAITGVLLILLSIIFAGTIGFITIFAVNAEEFSPLDFSSDYSNFSVNTGFDDIDGRYITYHYEFKE